MAGNDTSIEVCLVLLLFLCLEVLFRDYLDESVSLFLLYSLALRGFTFHKVWVLDIA